ncbi:MAG: nucleotidyltransferase family protein [Flammeovirgaceae bacterium]|nr:nucleotidyltransferase family protein [Flammeovirgaceae bacterium]
MMTREQVLTTLRKHKPDLQKKYPIANLELFGSYARNEQTPDSDVDLLIEFSGPIGWEIVDLVEYLENILHVKKVDLISKKFLKPRYKPYVESDLIHV